MDGHVESLGPGASARPPPGPGAGSRQGRIPQGRRPRRGRPRTPSGPRPARRGWRLPRRRLRAQHTAETDIEFGPGRAPCPALSQTRAAAAEDAQGPPRRGQLEMHSPFRYLARRCARSSLRPDGQHADLQPWRRQAVVSDFHCQGAAGKGRTRGTHAPRLEIAVGCKLEAVWWLLPTLQWRRSAGEGRHKQTVFGLQRGYLILTAERWRFEF